MIEVRIRLASEARAVRLCEWDAGNLDALIPTVDRWGVESDSNNHGITGNFVLYEGEAYFELIVHDSEE